MAGLCIFVILFLYVGISSALLLPGCKPSGPRSFLVDYTSQTFLKDGCPFNYVSGSIHYSRVPRAYWMDRIQKMAAAGLDAVQVYIPWNVHEPSPGVYDFSGQQDVVAFLQIVQQEGLVVILRAGPYICGEWDFGGLPAWLLQKNGSIIMRTMDPGYIAPVDRWFNVLLPKLRPLLYSTGGPVIMVQVENEYGSYFACDHGYMDHLAKMFRTRLGPDIVLFTTDGDGSNFLRCGTHPDLFITVDFGPSANASKNFDVLRNAQPGGPFVNSEFYTGWLDYWGHPHAHGSTTAIVNSLKQMLDLKASVNMYMFEGGTNFGYTNGADPPFNICPTSYDYDGPLTEAGDVTDKYNAIRTLIMQYKNITRPVPANTTKKAYGHVIMKRLGGVLDLVDHIVTRTTRSMYPLTMEQLGQSGGFMLYQTLLTQDYPGDTLSVTGVRDRAHIFVNGNFLGLIDRKLQTSLILTGAKGQSLELFIENQGHINFGTQINNGSKGLIANVTLRGDILTGWTIYPFNLSRLTGKRHTHNLHYRMARVGPSQGALGPAVFTGSFQLPKTDKTAADTFLNTTGWFKGQAFVNGFNLGRYWPVRGPQVTLYVPASVLKPYPTFNSLLMLELDHAPCHVIGDVMKEFNEVTKWHGDERGTDCAVTFENRSKINGPYRPYNALPPGRLAKIQNWRRGRVSSPQN